MLKTSKLFPYLLKNFNKNAIKQISTTNSLNSNYLSSPVVDNIEKYPEVEVIKNPPEWKYVERLIASSTIPKPKPKENYPSGWKPQTKFDSNTLKYFIGRTKNYMIPVYLQRTFRGQRHITIIKRIEGDIWQLEKELREIIEKLRNGFVCASRVNEMSGQIHFHGDYVNLVKDYLMKKGY